MKPLTIFISGPITGMSNNNHKAFEFAERIVKERGHIAYNPLKFEEHYTRPNDSWEGFMKRDIPYLMKADIMVTLPGHELSKGCKVERMLCETLKIPVMEFKDYQYRSEIGLQKEMLEAKKKDGVTLDAVMYACSIVTGVGVDIIKSKSRLSEAVQARQYFYYISNNLLNYRMVNIGRYVDRDHSTISTGIQKILGLMKYEDNVQHDIDRIKSFLTIN